MGIRNREEFTGSLDTTKLNKDESIEAYWDKLYKIKIELLLKLCFPICKEEAASLPHFEDIPLVDAEFASEAEKSQFLDLIFHYYNLEEALKYRYPICILKIYKHKINQLDFSLSYLIKDQVKTVSLEDKPSFFNLLSKKQKLAEREVTLDLSITYPISIYSHSTATARWGEPKQTLNFKITLRSLSIEEQRLAQIEVNGLPVELI